MTKKIIKTPAIKVSIRYSVTDHLGIKLDITVEREDLYTRNLLDYDGKCRDLTQNIDTDYNCFYIGYFADVESAVVAETNILQNIQKEIDKYYAKKRSIVLPEELDLTLYA